MNNTIKLLVAVILCMIFTNNCFSLDGSGTSKGLLILQVSWDNDSYADKNHITFNYNKTKASRLKKKSSIKGLKNATLQLELEPGEYEISTIELRTLAGLGRTISIPFAKSFSISPGQITNGGLIFLIKEPDSDQVYVIPVDNASDAKWHVSDKRKDFYKEGFSNFRPAWNFSAKEKIEAIIESYGKLLVSREMAKSKSKAKYLVGVLGVLIKLERDQNGALKNYKVLKTNTYNEVTGYGVYKNKLICLTSPGNYLYGAENDLRPIPTPEDVEGSFKIYLIGDNKLLLFDNNINIYSSTGTEIKWQKQSEFRREYKNFYPIELNFGVDHIYLYTRGTGEDRRLLMSDYDNVSFKKVEIPEEVKKITNLIETKDKLVIGPKTTSFVKKGSVIHVMDRKQNTWQQVRTPRGDCNSLQVDRNDNSKFTTSCAGSTMVFVSEDGGKTWKTSK